MASQQLSDASAYLTDAAHLMRTLSPQISAHLMAYRNGLLTHHDLSTSDIQRQRVCGACGNIHLAGSGSSVKLEARPTSTKKPRQPDASKGPIKVVQCGLCNKLTKTSMAVPGATARRKVARPSSMKTAAPVLGEAQKPNANATSKKRAKNRKAGLQALLSGQQQQSASPLSLADFMKK